MSMRPESAASTLHNGFMERFGGRQQGLETDQGQLLGWVQPLPRGMLGYPSLLGCTQNQRTLAFNRASLNALTQVPTSAQPAAPASMHLHVEERLCGGQLPMPLRPPGSILPEIPDAAAAEGVHPPVDMHQVGDLVPGKGKIQP